MDLKKWLFELEANVVKAWSLPSDQLMTDDFMLLHTRYEKIEDFVKDYLGSGNEPSMARIKNFVRMNTQFDCWEDMLAAALAFKEENDKNNTTDT